jgi:hypothetical protein
MHPPAQGIAHPEQTNYSVREGLYDRNLKSEPEILHHRAQRFAFIEQGFVANRERMQAIEERRRCACLSERLNAGARCGKRVARQIDAIKIPVVLAAILEMIVDLKTGTERVRSGPGGGTLAVDVEHEPADRHGGIAAIMDHLVPGLVTKFGHVHPKGDQHIKRMTRRHRALRERLPQHDRLFLAVAMAQKFGLEQIEKVELFPLGKACMIGDVVRSSDEVVERKNQRPMARVNDP